MKKIVTCGTLTMEIDRKQDALKSQRLIDALMLAKRENQDITEEELSYVAFGFRHNQRG